MRSFARVALVALVACNDPAAPPDTRPVASIRVEPDSVAIRISRTLQMFALLLDSTGDTLTGRSVVWSSSDTLKATVSPTGLVLGRAPGHVTVTAAAEGVAGLATMTVLIPVGAIWISPDTATLVPGGRLKLPATLVGTDGSILSDRPIVWSSNAPSVADVAMDGVITGLAVGEAHIAATSEGVTVYQPARVAVVRRTFVQLAAGPAAAHTCGIAAAGDVMCWGINIRGALGNGTADAPVPAWSYGLPFPTGIIGLGNVSAITTGGEYFTCALSGGSAFCWGNGGSGVLGNGSVNGTLTPAPVKGGHQFTALSSGANHSCAIAADSSAYCWGRPPGIGGSFPGPRAFEPVRVIGNLKFWSVRAGWHVSCGLAADSLAYCWGDGLGPESPQTPSTPPGGQKFRMITVGAAHACAIATDAVTYCWGDNEYGQLGVGSVVDTGVPTPVHAAAPFVFITAGWQSTCALTSDGKAYCWGVNSHGQLGVAATSETCRGQPCSTRPIATSAAVTHRLQALTGGATHFCGLARDDRAYCWGDNEYGQLGDGTTTSSTTPVLVAGQP